ncbi:cell division protein ZapA [Desulfothermobacter acidiphilus]|uniref:cell division protein ZapA n=1 Tax=Desulfothermobacter acidiphilus TaxID=1938353 RepID=UPI003F8BB348
MGEKNRVEVEIAGEPYVLVSEEPVEHIQKVAQLVHDKVREMRRRNPRLPLNRAIVLAALNLAHEYLRLQENYDSLVQLIEKEGGS